MRFKPCTSSGEYTELSLHCQCGAAGVAPSATTVMSSPGGLCCCCRFPPCGCTGDGDRAWAWDLFAVSLDCPVRLTDCMIRRRPPNRCRDGAARVSSIVQKPRRTSAAQLTAPISTDTSFASRMHSAHRAIGSTAWCLPA